MFVSDMLERSRSAVWWSRGFTTVLLAAVGVRFVRRGADGLVHGERVTPITGSGGAASARLKFHLAS